MNLIFFCQSVLESDPVIADTISRIKEFSKNEKVIHVDVICLRGEKKVLTEKISVYPIQPTNRSRIVTLFRLVRTLIALCRNKKVDAVYLYMTPTVAPFFFLLKPFFGYKVVTWFGHSIYTPVTKISLLYFTDLWLNANKSMAPFIPSHLRLIGQGTDPLVFYPQDIRPEYDLITVGRITKAKKLELIIDALKYCKITYNKSYTLFICGDPYVKADIEYKQGLIKYIEDQGVMSQVVFAGAIPRESLRVKLNSARAFVFTSPGGVGKSSVEALACGIPLIITSPEASDFFGADLASSFLCAPNPAALGSKIHECLNRSAIEAANLKNSSLRLFKESYSLESFVGRAVDEIELKIK